MGVVVVQRIATHIQRHSRRSAGARGGRGIHVLQQGLTHSLRQLVDHAHAVQELPRLARAAAQLQHGVRDGHYLAKNNLVHTAHGLFAFFFAHVVPRPVVGDRLQL